MAFGLMFRRELVHEALLQMIRQITKLTDIIEEVAKDQKQIAKDQKQMITDISALQDQVQQNATVEESAVVLIKGLAKKLDDAKNDPVAVQSLIDQLHASANDLAAAVTANTDSQETSPVTSLDSSPFS